MTEAEAAQLREYDRKVMEIINVDDFTTDELAAAVREAPSAASGLRQIA